MTSNAHLFAKKEKVGLFSVFLQTNDIMNELFNLEKVVLSGWQVFQHLFVVKNTAD